MAKKVISSAVVKRLPRYYRYLSELLENDIGRISSKELSERMNVTASQIRQDFNNFGGFGQQGYGYNVEYLRNEIGKILGLDRHYNVIIVGAGNLGQALANYAGFERRGFNIIGIFDVNTRLQGVTIRGLEIRMMDDLEEFVRTHEVNIAALTIPKSKACQVAADLASWGVNAFWNFASTDLHLPAGMIVENVHLAESLMRLSYNIANRDETDE
ncbi:MAG: redox-sensing transcriptional repressor Rex [Lachnospiraceae bacterium]|nr:redox-sensing transcriptional repressor Rex [Lachnospiraceae bacterium]